MSECQTNNLRRAFQTAESRSSVSGMARVGQERMDTFGMLRSEISSLIENHPLVQGFHRAMADPGEIVLGLLKPVIVLVALALGLIGAVLILEARAGATPTVPAANVEPQEATPVVEAGTDPSPAPGWASAPETGIASESKVFRPLRKTKRTKKHKHRRRRRRGKRRR